MKTHVNVSTTGKLRKNANVTMKQATQAETKTTTSSMPNNSQIRQRFSRSIAKTVRRSPGALNRAWLRRLGADRPCLTLRWWFQLRKQW